MTAISGVAFEHSQGATFKLTVETGLDLSAATIKSQVRSALTDALIAELSVTPIDLSLGSFTLSGPTQAWPVGRAIWDIAITFASSEKVISELVIFEVKKAATR